MPVIKYCIKNAAALLSICISVIAFLSCNKNSDSKSQDGIYRNGNLSTGLVSNSGITAPAGTSWSENQADISSNTSNWGVGVGNYYNNNRNIWTGDDFNIPAGQKWNISKISFYGMAWNVTSNPFDILHLQIWNGKPGLPGSSVIYGNRTSNVLSNVIDTLIYGIRNSLIPSPGITPDLTSKFWKLEANVDINLNSGTYWLVWQTHIVSETSAFTPYIKIKNIRSHPSWNAVIANTPGNWETLVDPGNPDSAPDLPQDLPFEIVYTY